MNREHTYRKAATELRREARDERNVSTRFELELLALAYDRLADQAQRNAQNNLVYEYDPQSIAHRRRRAQAQQQQQGQGRLHRYK